MLPSPKFKHDLVVARNSLTHGYGLFAVRSIKRNTRICDYVGEKLSYDQYRTRYPKPLDRYYYRGRNLWVIVSDKEPYLSTNPVNYINEGVVNVRLRGGGLYAVRDLNEGEELFLSYPKSYKRSWVDPNRDLMTVLEEKLSKITIRETFPPRPKRSDAKSQRVLRFGRVVRPFHTKEGAVECLGSRKYPQIEELLNRIAKTFFPDFQYNHIQINKNLLTKRHQDDNNTGDTVMFCVGQYKGGGLGLDTGAVDTYKRPYRFNGGETYHWTEPFEGDRYCVIYFTNEVNC